MGHDPIERFGRDQVKRVRHLEMRIPQNKVKMQILVHIAKERERRREQENAKSRRERKKGYQNELFPLRDHDKGAIGQ